MIRILAVWLVFVSAVLTAGAQQNLPSAQPVMTVTGPDGDTAEETAYDGSAPMQARFTACPQDVGEYTPLYEWRFSRAAEEAPFLIRYEEDTGYTFAESGAYRVELRVSFVLGTDTVEYVMDQPFTVNISESKLELPNAFTPNGDGINDIYRVKDGYQSIVSFKATVFNRWGKKLYSWSALDGGWDGRSGGSEVPDGAYYLVVEARGADGRNYNAKKVINLLRGFTESSATAP